MLLFHPPQFLHLPLPILISHLARVPPIEPSPSDATSWSGWTDSAISRDFRIAGSEQPFLVQRTPWRLECRSETTPFFRGTSNRRHESWGSDG